MQFFAGLGIYIVFVAIAMMVYALIYILLFEDGLIRALCVFAVIALVSGIFFATFIIDPESYGYAKIEKIESDVQSESVEMEEK